MSKKIFVSIASYRDTQCGNTISEVFNKADHPENIYIGVYENIKNDNERYTYNLKLNNPSLLSHVFVESDSYTDAEGPNLGRYNTYQIYTTQIKDTYPCDFVFVIDSHCQFLKGWDTEYIRMNSELVDFGIQKPIVTNYPTYDSHGEAISFTNPDNINVMYWMDMVSGYGLRVVGVINNLYPHTYYYNAACGFISCFAPITIIDDVPFDPDLKYCFCGEEPSVSIRAWMLGYDFFSPDKNVQFHTYIRDNHPRPWYEPLINWNNVPAYSKVMKYYDCLLLGCDWVDYNITTDGMIPLPILPERTLDDYWNFVGVTKTDTTFDVDYDVMENRPPVVTSLGSTFKFNYRPVNENKIKHLLKKCGHGPIILKNIH